MILLGPPERHRGGGGRSKGTDGQDDGRGGSGAGGSVECVRATQRMKTEAHSGRPCSFLSRGRAGWGNCIAGQLVPHACVCVTGASARSLRGGRWAGM